MNRAKGQIAEDGVVGEANGGDVEVDQLRAEVVAGAEGHWEADLPQGGGGTSSDARERPAGSEPLQRHVEEAEGLHREHIEAGTTIDEGPGDGHLADGGGAQHRERARANGVEGVVLRVEG